MKIAVCISGHMRCYKEIKTNYEMFIEKLKQHGTVDVFVATWNKKNTNFCWSSKHGHQSSDDADEQVTLQDIQEHYSPKDVVIFDYDFYASEYSPLKSSTVSKFFNMPENSIFTDNGVINGYKQFFIVYQSNVLKKFAEFKHKSKYDLVIRLRPDYFFTEVGMKYFNIDNIEVNTLYAHSFGPTPDDQFYYGDSELMDKVMSNFLRMGYGVVNWVSDMSCFVTLIDIAHPDIQIKKLETRIGVLPNYPLPDEFATYKNTGDMPKRSWR